MTPPKAKPILFSNGAQFLDWMEQNCFRCKKYRPYEQTHNCELEEAMYVARMSDGDGSVPAEVAARLGYRDPREYTWDCTEREVARE